MCIRREYSAETPHRKAQENISKLNHEQAFLEFANKSITTYLSQYSRPSSYSLIIHILFGAPPPFWHLCVCMQSRAVASAEAENGMVCAGFLVAFLRPGALERVESVPLPRGCYVLLCFALALATSILT